LEALPFVPKQFMLEDLTILFHASMPSEDKPPSYPMGNGGCFPWGKADGEGRRILWNYKPIHRQSLTLPFVTQVVWSYNRVTWRKSSVLEEPNASILGFKKRWPETLVSFTDCPASLPKHINLQSTDDRKLQKIVRPSCPTELTERQKTRINMNCTYRYSSYRAVNTLNLRYKRQSVNELR